MQVQGNLDEEQRLHDFFKDYPTIHVGLGKLGMEHPTYLQSEVLHINSDIENLVICAPEHHGRKVAALLYGLKKFVNCEQGALAVLVHSKEAAFHVQHVLATLTHLPCFNLYQKQPPEDLLEKLTVVGSPMQIEALRKDLKDRVQYMLALEFDYLTSFGYSECLHRLFESSQAAFVLVVGSESKELAEFKEKYFKKTLNVTLQPEVEGEKVESQVSHFFSVGEPLYKHIALYLILKFGLIHPKILILCPTQREVYRTALFLERCRVHGVGLYNPDNPVNVRFYGLSLWLTGGNGILVSTPKLLSDLKSNVFTESCRAAFKKSHFDLKSLSAIITLNISYMRNNFSQLFEAFSGRSRILNLIDNTDNERQTLQALILYERQQFETVKIKDFPISRQEQQAFNYRIGDVMDSVGGKKPDWFAEMDLKKKILKSKDLAKYFQQHVGEKELLQKRVLELNKKISHGKIELGEEVPEYLVPQFLKAAYMERIKEKEKEEFKKLIPKKKPEPMETEAPEQPQEGEHQPRKDNPDAKINRALASINPNDENPETTDPSRLKLLSRRKRWKLQHGFKLKKRNLRNERKGIFD